MIALRVTLWLALVRRAWKLRSWRKARDERRRFEAMIDRIISLSEDRP